MGTLQKSKLRISLDKLLTINSEYDRGTIKRRVLQEGLLDNKCSECGLKDTWNNKIIILQLDHINGIPNDNRIENLRILCPNCHSQTNTFTGRKRVNVPNINNRKVERPSKEELEKLLWEIPTTKIAEQFGVSDKAISKWAKAYNLSKPSRGYWAKLDINKKSAI